MSEQSLRWAVPVLIQHGPRIERIFNCVHDALDYLENEWPTRKGEHYSRARISLRAALSRSMPIEVAREAFLAACIEASLLKLPDYSPKCGPNGGQLRASA
jgi:hypothetical protein